MKLLLLTFVVCFAAVLAVPAADKQKRDILPGDPRYGNNHEHENEVQIGKAAGGYVGSYAVPDESQSAEAQPQLQSVYGPPDHKVGQLLGSDFLTTSDNAKSTIGHVPSTSYGIPDTQTALDLNTDYQAPSAGAPITSYSSAQTTVHEQPKYDVVQKSALISEHNNVQPAVVNKHVETVSVPQVKVTTSETQGVFKNTVPSFTPSIKTFSGYSNIPVKTIDTHVQVQVPHPYPVPVTKHVAYPIAVPHRIDVPKPYYVRVAQPVQVPVNRPYPVEIPRPVPYPVPHYVRTNVPVIQPHHYSASYPVNYPASQLSSYPASYLASYPASYAASYPASYPASYAASYPAVSGQASVTLDSIKASNNPFQGFFENPQVQNVLTNVPSFQNPLEGLHNPFENFELPSFPNLPSFPSSPSLPSLPSLPAPQQPSQHVHAGVSSATNTDAVAVDSPALKEKPKTYKPSTACAGCSVGGVSSASNVVSSASSNAFTIKQQDQAREHVQAIDANGGYVY